MYKEKLAEVMSKELSRREFLQASGILILGLLGLPALLDTVQKAFSGGSKKTVSVPKLSNGYGDRPYGK